MSNLNVIDRRAFLHRASSTALTLPLIGLGIMELTSCASATGTKGGGVRFVLADSEADAWQFVPFVAKNLPGGSCR